MALSHFKVDHDTDTEIIVQTRRRGREAKPPFLMVATGETSYAGVKGMSAITISKTLSRASFFVLFFLIEVMDPSTNVVDARKLDIPDSELKKCYRGLPDLYTLDVARRIGNRLYMVNPYFIIPAEFNKAVIRWNKIPVAEGAKEFIPE